MRKLSRCFLLCESAEVFIDEFRREWTPQWGVSRGKSIIIGDQKNHQMIRKVLRERGPAGRS